MFTLRFISCITALCIINACTPADTPNPEPNLPHPNSGPAYTASGHAPQHGLDLFLHVARQKQKNICLSPYSAHTALALVRPGARGETLRQIDRTIGPIETLAAQARTTSLPLELANLACIEQTLPLKPEYKQALPSGSYLSADFINHPDLERTTINRWTADRTHGRILNIIPPNVITPLTRMALVNAIYTKAEWEHPFNPAKTADKPFHLENGQTTSCPTLQHTAHYRHIDSRMGEAIAIPFKKRQDKQETCLIAILPKKGTTLSQHLSTLTPADIRTIRQQLATATPRKTLLEIPKFQTETSTDLTAAFAKTGIPDACDRNKANLSGITDSRPPLHIAKILQKTYFEMNEKGIEAAAATALIAEKSLIPSAVRFDSPFIWIIADLDPETTPYFIGTLYTPAR